MLKAYWQGYEIIEIDYKSHSGWCDIVFMMDDYSSPITGTGRRYVRMDEIVIEEEACSQSLI